MTEEFFEFCSEGSLPIEIYGHRRKCKKSTGALPEGESDESEDAVANLHDSITQKNKHLIDRLNSLYNLALFH